MASLRAGRWQSGVGFTLRGKTLGVLGYGRIGRTVAGYGAAFGMRVQIWASESSRARAAADGWTVAESRASFFATSDVVCLHLRLVPATRGCVTLADLRSMKPSALLVNTSRAGLIEPGALEAALAGGRPGFAATDVFDEEPLRAEPALLRRFPQAVATPHIGYVSRDEFEEQFSDVLDQVLVFAAGKPTHVVNPAVLARARARAGSDHDHALGAMGAREALALSTRARL
jgi:D-3-phosphoglycerate dehydrogenase